MGGNRNQAEQVIVGLGHRLGRPVLVHGPHLELLEVAAIWVRARRLARRLVGVDLCHVWVSWVRTAFREDARVVVGEGRPAGGGAGGAGRFLPARGPRRARGRFSPPRGTSVRRAAAPEGGGRFFPPPGACTAD